MFFSFENNPKYLDPSYTTDQDIKDCFRRENLISKQKVAQRTFKTFGIVLKTGKAQSYKQRYTASRLLKISFFNRPVTLKMRTSSTKPLSFLAVPIIYMYSNKFGETPSTGSRDRY